MIPIAVDRSSGAIHSDTTRAAAGNPPPSPIPSRNRHQQQRKACRQPHAARTQSDHQTMIAMNPRRVPSKSSSRPPITYIAAYDSRNAVCRYENCWLVIGIFRWIAEIATGSVCRSK
jgi:hypothetical protein